MTSFQLLLVEDEEQFIEEFRTITAEFSEHNQRQITLTVKTSVEDAKSFQASSVDAAIVDLNLGSGTSDGGEVIDELKQYFRFPVAILTGTPEDADREPPVVGVYTRGEHCIEEILEHLWNIYETGLTKILGGKGQLENHLNKVFLTNLIPTIDIWLDYGSKNKAQTQRALLRYTLGHLIADLEGEESSFYPEEVYLTPPLDSSLKTGSLIRCRDGETIHVVLTPACDLVRRQGKPPKTDFVVVAEIIPETTQYEKLEMYKNRDKRLRNNIDVKYLHWLPNSKDIDGGFIDFRRLRTVSMAEFNSVFNPINARIAPNFIKDIVSRFSAFYARQGQPDIYTENS